MLLNVTLPRVLIALCIVAFLGFLCWLAIVYRRKEVYTRERFAFTAVAAWFALATAVVGGLVHKESVWDSIIGLISSRPATEPLRGSDGMLMLLVLAIAGYVILQLHNSWSGAISVRQFERQRYRRPSSLPKEAIEEGARLLRRSPPFEVHNREASRSSQSALVPPSASFAWHKEARDLLFLHNRALEFDPESDWHMDAHCWIGTNKQTGQMVAVCCSDSAVSGAELDAFLNYVERLCAHRDMDYENTELWVAVRELTDSVGMPTSGARVRFVNEASLLEGLVDFTGYFNHLRARVTRNPLPDSALTLNQVYVPSFVRGEDGVRIEGTLEDYLSAWIGEPGERQLALLGEYGQGKSTSSLLFAHHFVEAHARRQPRVPILIELRGKTPQNLTPEQLIAIWAEPYSISPAAIMKLIVAGRVLLILEGFDEMAQVGEAMSRIAHFRTLWKFCYPRAKILITGRPNLFLDDVEMRAALGISKASMAGPYCEAVYLLPFDLGKSTLRLGRLRSKLVKKLSTSPQKMVNSAILSPEGHCCMS